jgi:hypothetical protein
LLHHVGSDSPHAAAVVDAVDAVATTGDDTALDSNSNAAASGTCVDRLSARSFAVGIADTVASSYSTLL